MATVLLTILKIAAGLAALGVISLVLVAVISGIRSSVGALGGREDHDDNSGVG
jgi:hypothetical protein